MLTVSLCDDNAQERAYIKSLVLDWLERSGAMVSIREYPSAEALLFSYSDNPPDILLLDIEMPGMNGVELAKRLRERAETVQIIFITGYSDFIAEGYDVSALHYLLKPVKKEKLFSVLDRAVEKIADDGKKLLQVLDRAYKVICEEKPPETVVFRAGMETLRFKLSDIEYIVALGHSTVLSADGKTYDLSVPISEAEKALGEGFIRCHRSYIVNLKYVSAVSSGTLTLDSGVKIPVARGSKKAVAEEFVRYYRG